MAAPDLAVGSVHVWRVDLDAAPVGVKALPDEHERAARMRSDRQRARFLAGRGWLRVVLGSYVGAEPSAVRILTADRGKPSLADGGDLRFSHSRSAGAALVAVVRGQDIGVDVEQVRHGVDHTGLGDRFFCPAEAAILRGLPEADRRHEFFRLWARKEAVVKASGAGIGGGIAHLDVRSGSVAGRWSLASLETAPGFAAAVAVEGAMGPITTFDT